MAVGFRPAASGWNAVREGRDDRDLHLLQARLPAAAATAAAAESAATTTAASAAAEATAATATAAGALFAGTGFIDRQRPPAVLLAVERRNRRLGFLVVGHLDEAKTLGPAGVAIDQ